MSDAPQGVAGADEVQRPYSLTLARLADRAEREVAASLEGSGLRVDDWRILDHLARTGNSTMSGLADGSLLAGATLTRTVDRLVLLGYLHRTQGIADRRQVLVNLSRRGVSAHEEYRESVARAELAALRSAASDQDLRRLASLLLSA